MANTRATMLALESVSVAQNHLDSGALESPRLWGSGGARTDGDDPPPADWPAEEIRTAPFALLSGILRS